MGEARAVFRNAGALAAAQMIERISGITLTFVLARALGAEGLGIYSGALAVYAFIAIGGQLGATTFVVREISRDLTRTSTYVVHFGVVVACASATLAVAVIALIPVLGFSSTLAAAVTLVLAAVVPGTLNVIFEGVFIAHQRTHIQTILTLVAQVVNVGASVALLASGHGVVAVLAVFVAVQYLLAASYLTAIATRIAPIRGPFRPSVARRLIGESRAFIGSSVLGALFSRPEVLLLTVITSEAQVGYFAAALKIVDVWYFIPTTFAMNVYPLLARSHRAGRERLQEIQDKSLRFLLAFALPVSGATLVLAGPLIDLAYGDDLAPAVTPLRILAANVCLSALFELLWRVLSARDEQGAVLRVQAVTTFTRLGGGVALIGWFTAVGAAVNMAVNMVLHIALLIRAVRRDGTRFRLPQLALRPGIAALGSSAVAAALLGPAGFVVATAAATAAYAVLALALGAVSPADIRLLRRDRTTEPATPEAT
ncbi:MAG: flippase [Thermoleophilia bacterium]|nr:flippase [Thermoleophilia bacterium]